MKKLFAWGLVALVTALVITPAQAQAGRSERWTVGDVGTLDLATVCITSKGAEDVLKWLIAHAKEMVSNGDFAKHGCSWGRDVSVKYLGIVDGVAPVIAPDLTFLVVRIADPVSGLEGFSWFASNAIDPGI